MTTARKNLAVAILPVSLLLTLGLSLRYLPGMLLGSGTSEPAPDPSSLRQHHRHHPRPAPVDPPQPVDAMTQKSGEQAAGGQIAAFGQGNYDLALAFSNPNFRSEVSSDHFREMILSRYQPLTTAKSVHFGSEQRVGSVYILPVTVSSAAGSDTHYLYQLVQGDGGRLYVTGCAPAGGTPPMMPARPHTPESVVRERADVAAEIQARARAAEDAADGPVPDMPPTRP